MTLGKKGEIWINSLVMLLFICAAILPIDLSAQEENEKVYKLDPWIDGGIIAGTLVLSKLAIDAQNEQPLLSEEEVFALDPMDVNAFDRGVIFQNPDQLAQGRTNSDRALNATTALIFLLALDKKARHHWLEGLVMYVEAMTVNASVQGWVAYGTNRYRPIAYMEDANVGQRTDSRNKNSFYSGHTSSAATSSFFVAKMFSDLHPELGNKKYWLFAAALIPPAVVGGFRIAGAKHFYTDVMIGMAMGAATGILIPHFHKLTGNNNMTLVPIVQPDVLGMHFSMNF